MRSAGIDRRTLLGSAAVMALQMASGGLVESARAQTRGGTLTLSYNEPRHLNPAFQPDASTAIPGAQLFAGLIQLDENFQPVPYLAESWSVSGDGRSYTFKLRSNAVFHDGKPVTAADVAFSIQTVKANHPYGNIIWDRLETVEAPDGRTAVIRLSKPHPALFAGLVPNLMPVLPKHVFDGQDIKTHPANMQPIGSGPFKFARWEKGQNIRLEHFDQFFREGRPFLDAIVIRFLGTDPTANLMALQTGEVDYRPMPPIRTRDIKKLQSDPALVVTPKGHEAFGPINFLEFNLRKKPFDDIRVRRAFAHAIDKDFITQKLHQGLSTRLDGPLHHANRFASKDLTIYNYDPTKATALLDEAGLKPDGAGVRIRATIDFAPYHVDSQQTVAEYLKSSLLPLGIELTVRPNPDFATWAQKVGNWDYDLTMNSTFNWSDPLIGVHRGYVCSNIKKAIYTNTSGYCNPEVDAILAKAADEFDFEKRKSLYAEFQKIVTEDLPVIWTNEEPYVDVFRKSMQDPPLTVWGAFAPFDHVWMKR